MDDWHLQEENALNRERLVEEEWEYIMTLNTMPIITHTQTHVLIMEIYKFMILYIIHYFTDTFILSLYAADINYATTVSGIWTFELYTIFSVLSNSSSVLDSHYLQVILNIYHPHLSLFLYFSGFESCCFSSQFI